jgi:hypothetical protein
MGDERSAPETKGVTSKLLAALDLGPEIEGMAGRQLRMRLVTFEGKTRDTLRIAGFSERASLDRAEPPAVR